jgi:hypothetical protein
MPPKLKERRLSLEGKMISQEGGRAVSRKSRDLVASHVFRKRRSWRRKSVRYRMYGLGAPSAARQLGDHLSGPPAESVVEHWGYWER